MSTDISNKKEYNAIDLAKFISALLVVAIHVAPFGENDIKIFMLANFAIKNWISRIAVPLFFASSGFFLFKKVSYEAFSWTPIVTYVKRMIKLYIIWSIIYLPIRIPDIINCDRGIVIGILEYCRDFVFDGSYLHLWYFPALIVAVLFVAFLVKRKISLRNILIITCVLYAIGLLAQTWFGVIKPIESDLPAVWSVLKAIQNVIVTTRNGLFEASLFVGMGAFIAKNGFRIKAKTALVLAIASFFLMFVEVFFVRYFNISRLYDMCVFLVPLTFFTFGFLINFRIPSTKDIYKKMRLYSTLIFYIHLWIKWILIKFFEIFNFDIERTFLLFVFTVILSVGTSYLIMKISNLRHFKWLSKIYS